MRAVSRSISARCSTPRCWSLVLERLDGRQALEILVCPVTKGPLIFDRERQELISRSARLAYPIRDGIPVLLEDEARKLTPEEVEALKDK